MTTDVYISQVHLQTPIQNNVDSILKLATTGGTATTENKTVKSVGYGETLAKNKLTCQHGLQQMYINTTQQINIEIPLQNDNSIQFQ